MSFDDQFPTLVKMVPLNPYKYEMRAWTENVIENHCLDRSKVEALRFKVLDYLKSTHPKFRIIVDGIRRDPNVYTQEYLDSVLFDIETLFSDLLGEK